MKKHFLAIAALLSLSAAFLFMPIVTAATTTFTCNGVETSIDYGCNKYNTDSISAILMYIINFMGIGVGIAVVAGIAWGGLTYARAGGNSSTTKEGISIITNSIIGLVLFIALWALANFFIPGGAFNLNAKTANYTPAGPVTGPGTGNGGNPPGSSGSISSIDGLYNFRDAGGSGIIKSGILYRSAKLDSASSAGDTSLKQLLQGGTIIDLRTKGEIKSNPDPKLKGVTPKQFNINGTTKYADYVNVSASRAAFGDAITYIATQPGPFLIHCTYGKDRTGWTIAMIMYALGASDSQVMNEFMASNGNLPGNASVKESYLTDGLSAIKKKYSTVNNYLKKGLGLSQATLDALKKKLGA